jgi:hypothetical protein
VHSTGKRIRETVDANRLKENSGPRTVGRWVFFLNKDKNARKTFLFGEKKIRRGAVIILETLL